MERWPTDRQMPLYSLPFYCGLEAERAVEVTTASTPAGLVAFCYEEIYEGTKALRAYPIK